MTGLELEVAEALASAQELPARGWYRRVRCVVRGHGMVFLRGFSEYHFWVPDPGCFDVESFMGCETLESAIRVVLTHAGMSKWLEGDNRDITMW